MEYDGGFARFEICEDERDRLRVFLLNKVQQVRGIGSPYKIEGAHLERTREAVDDVDRFLASERFFEEFARIVYTAGRDEILRVHQLLEFFKNGVFKFRIDRFQTRYFKRQRFDFVFAKMLHDFGGNVAAERYEEDRGLLPAG